MRWYYFVWTSCSIYTSDIFVVTILDACHIPKFYYLFRHWYMNEYLILFNSQCVTNKSVKLRAICVQVRRFDKAEKFRLIFLIDQVYIWLKLKTCPVKSKSHIW